MVYATTPYGTHVLKVNYSFLFCSTCETFLIRLFSFTQLSSPNTHRRFPKFSTKFLSPEVMFLTEWEYSFDFLRGLFICF